MSNEFSRWRAAAADQAPLPQTVILAGGKGARLGAATAHVPKPMLPVAGAPFLDRLIWEFALAGAADVVVAAGHFGEQIASHYDGHPVFGDMVRVVIEPAPLGTGGALRHLRNTGILADVFMVLNGDTMAALNPWRLVAALQAHPDAAGIIGLRRVEDAGRFGSVVLGRSSGADAANSAMIADFTEKGGGGPGLINAGVYIFRRDLLAPKLGQGVLSLETDVLPALVAEKTLRGGEAQGFFIDIGTPQTLEASHAAVAAFQNRPALILDRDGVVNLDHGYVATPERTDWVDGIFDLVRAANDQTIPVFVATNQAGVARGYYSLEDMRAYHRWMGDAFHHQGANITHFFYCPHHPEAADPAFRRSCARRKPAPGMLDDVFRHFSAPFAPLDRAASLFVGDRDTDRAAAAAAGVGFTHFDVAEENLENAVTLPARQAAVDVSAAVWGSL